MSITNRGKKWELLNSRWIIWSFLYPLNCIGFFIIGYKTENRKFKLIGCALLILCCVLPMYLREINNINIVFANIIVLVSIITYIVGIVISFKYRKEHLIRKDLILSNIKNTDEELKNKIKSEYLNKSNYTNIDSILNKKDKLQNSEDKIDINTCTEEILLNLPGINIITAKKSIEYRNTHNGFSSFEQFIELMDIKPHFAIQLKDLITITPIEIKNNNIKKSGRKLDV